MNAYFITLLLLTVAMADNWIGTLYKTEQKLSTLDGKIEEAEDIIRHLSERVSDMRIELPHAFAGDRASIERKIGELQSQIAVQIMKKNRVLKVIKRIVKSVPTEYRERIIRNTHLEKRFNEISDIIKSTRVKKN